MKRPDFSNAPYYFPFRRIAGLCEPPLPPFSPFTPPRRHHHHLSSSYAAKEGSGRFGRGLSLLPDVLFFNAPRGRRRGFSSPPRQMTNHSQLFPRNSTFSFCLQSTFNLPPLLSFLLKGDSKPFSEVENDKQTTGTVPRFFFSP